MGADLYAVDLDGNTWLKKSVIDVRCTDASKTDGSALGCTAQTIDDKSWGKALQIL
jgi:hypothetical protein